MSDGRPVLERCEPDGYMCPACKSAAATPFSCGGPHPMIRKDGTLGKRRVYRFVEARPVRFCDAR
jgi:hypothetical protein